MLKHLLAAVLAIQLSQGALLAQVDLDLSSTNKTLSAPQDAGNAVITVGGEQKTIQPQAALTPAEFAALNQVLSGAEQSLELAALGNAVGGSLQLTQELTSALSGLTVPHGVSVVKDFGSGAALDVAGQFRNEGSFFAISTNESVRSATVNLSSLANMPGGTISTVLPDALAGAFPSTVASLNLNINVVNDLINQGTIFASGNLSVSAGGQVANVGSSAVMQAAQSLSVYSAAGQLVNSGIITAMTNNLSVMAAVNSSLAVANSQGQILAPAGKIDFGNEGLLGKVDLNITGGDLLAREINLYSGDGAVKVDIEKLTGVTSVFAGEAQIAACTDNLEVGRMVLSGDPAIFNTLGNVTISSDLIFPGQHLAVVARGDIVTQSGGTGYVIDTSSPSANGGDITLVAGANFTNGSTINITGASSTGGKIDLNTNTKVTAIRSTSGAGSAGNINLIAFSGTVSGSGSILLPASGQLVLNGVGRNGDLLIVSGAAGGLGVAGGQVSSVGASGGGTVSINAALPVISGPSVVITDGRITSGGFLVGANRPGSVTQGAINAFGAVSITSSSTVNLNQITTSAALTIKGGNSVSASGVLLANTINLQASGNIGASNAFLQTKTNSISITAGASAFVREQDALTVTSASAASALHIMAGGHITTNGVVASSATTLETLAGSNGNITLNANVSGTSVLNLLASGSGSIVQISGMLNGMNLLLASGSGDVGTSSKPISANTNFLRVTSARNAYVSTFGALSVGSSTVQDLLQVTSQGALNVTGVLTGSNISLRTSVVNGSINVGANINATGSVLLAAFNSGAVTQSGGVLITGDIVHFASTTGNIGTTGVNMRAAANTISASTAGSAFLFNNKSVALGSSSVGNALQLSAAGNITVEGLVQAGSIRLQTTLAPAGIQLSNNLQAGTSVILIAAGGGAIAQTPAFVIDTPSLQMSSGSGNIGQSGQPISTSAGTLAANTAGTGSVYVSSSGPVTLLNSSAGDVFEVKAYGGVTLSGSVSAPVVRLIDTSIVLLSSLDLTDPDVVSMVLNLQARDLLGGQLAVEDGIAVGGTLDFAPDALDTALTAVVVPENVTVTARGFNSESGMVVALADTEVLISGTFNFEPAEGGTEISLLTVTGASGVNLVISPSGALSSAGDLTLLVNGAARIDGSLSVAGNLTLQTTGNDGYLEVNGSILTGGSATIATHGAGNAYGSGSIAAAAVNLSLGQAATSPSVVNLVTQQLAASAWGDLTVSNSGSLTLSRITVQGTFACTAPGDIEIAAPVDAVNLLLHTPGSNTAVIVNSTVTVNNSIDIRGDSSNRFHLAAGAVVSSVAGHVDLIAEDVSIDGSILAANVTIVSGSHLAVASNGRVQSAGSLAVRATDILTFSGSGKISVGFFDVAGGAVSIDLASSGSIAAGGMTISSSGGTLLFLNNGALEGGAALALSASGSLTISGEGRIHAGSLSLTSTNGAVTLDQNVVDARVSGSAGTAFTAYARGSGLTAGDISTALGSIRLTAGQGVLRVEAGAELHANEGNVVLKNMDAQSGSIVIGNGARLIAYTATCSCLGDIFLTLAELPQWPVAGGKPQGISLHQRYGGKVYFGRSGLVATSPGNDLWALGSDIVFNAPGRQDAAIVLEGNVYMNADPPPILATASVSLKAAGAAQSSAGAGLQQGQGALEAAPGDKLAGLLSILPLASLDPCSNLSPRLLLQQRENDGFGRGTLRVPAGGDAPTLPLEPTIQNSWERVLESDATGVSQTATGRASNDGGSSGQLTIWHHRGDLGKAITKAHAHLEQGEMVAHASGPSTISMSGAQLKLRGNALVHLRADGRCFTVKVLSNSHRESVVLHVGQQQISLLPGEELSVVENMDGVQWLSKEALGRRRLVTRHLEDGRVIVRCDFSSLSLIGKSALLRSILLGSEAAERQASRKFMKMAASLMMVTGKHGRYLPVNN